MDLDVTASLSFSFRECDRAGRVVVRHHYDNSRRIMVFALGQEQLYRRSVFGQGQI